MGILLQILAYQVVPIFLLVQILQKQVVSPLFLFSVYQLVDLHVSIIVVVATNVVVNVVNVLDLQWSPSNLHIHPLQSANDPHLLETLCHVNSLALFPQLSLLLRCHLWYLLRLLPQLCLLWRCHLWYCYSLFNCLNHCWCYMVPL